jgi:hypothetical protein
MVLGAKVLLNDGGATATTVNVALAGVVFETVTGVTPSMPCEVKLPAGIVLIRAPGKVAVTSTST